MNAEHLLSALPKLGEDPDQIQRLRKIAVALAVSGKLDDRDTSLSSAQLLEAVELTKTALVEQGVLSKQRKVRDLTAESLPEGFTDVMRFAPLGSLAWIEKGRTPITKATPGSFPLVVTATERALCDHFDFDGAAAIVPLVSSAGHGKASLNRLHYQEGKFALGTILAAVFPYDPAVLSARFLFEYLSAFKDELLVSRMTGTANVALSVSRIAEVPVPLVCSEVQKKVDKLMTLCDHLEETHNTRETMRDRLTTATLTRLTAPDTDNQSFRTHARFALDTLPALTARPGQIKILRQTILNLAVRGKLVEQDPGDEPASELLKRIAAEKARLIKEGGIRRTKAPPALNDTELPFPLPQGWAWSQIADLGFVSPRNDAPDDHLASFVHMSMIASEYGVSHQHEPRSWGDIKKGYTHFAEGDVGLAKITPCFENGKSTVFRNLTGRIGAGTTELYVARPLFVSADYILLFLKSLHFIETGIGKMTGTAGQKRVPKEYFANSPFPLPPLAEQHRIVAEVDKLMALYDHLEASLVKADAMRRRLLESLLHEILQPSKESPRATC